jgi:hypothetical protein
MHLVPCLRFNVASPDGDKRLEFQRTCFSGKNNQGIVYTGDESGNLDHAVRWLRYFVAFVGAIQEEFGLTLGNPNSRSRFRTLLLCRLGVILVILIAPGRGLCIS